MTAIENDKQLKAKLDALELTEQRKLAAQFVRNVLHLSNDPRVEKALRVAEDPQADSDDLFNAYKQVKTVATKSYTDCGSDTDWNEQAEHFVASAAMACLTPENLLVKGKSLAWKTAMQARMAKNCEMIEKDNGEVDNEAAKQYQMTTQF